MRVIGVDGCRGGWLAALVDDTGPTWRWSTDIAGILAEDADAIAIDTPIGLPDAGSRACDVEARRLLGPRRSSVFAAPVRPVLDCATYAEARAVLAARGGASMSAQAFGIVRAVRAVDECLSAADTVRVVEAHPELAFRSLAGRDLAAKKTPEGHAQRISALSTVWPTVTDLVAAAPRPAAPDDALDALACAYVAGRWADGTATVLTDGRVDTRGLPMRIAY